MSIVLMFFFFMVLYLIVVSYKSMIKAFFIILVVMTAIHVTWRSDPVYMKVLGEELESTVTNQTMTVFDMMMDKFMAMTPFPDFHRFNPDILPKRSPLEEFYKDILDTEELPSDRVRKESEEEYKQRVERLERMFREEQENLQKFGKEAKFRAEKANADAVRAMMKPDKTMIAEVARQVVEEMKKEK